MSTPNVSPMFLILLCYYLISMCKVESSPAINFEQYEALQGKEFCAQGGNQDELKKMCERLAALSLVIEYNINNLVGGCQSYELVLKLANGGPAPGTSTENLLVCNFNFIQPIDLGNGPNIIFQGYSAGLGRGETYNDVMEYRFRNGKALPYKNHVNFLIDL